MDGERFLCFAGNGGPPPLQAGAVFSSFRTGFPELPMFVLEAKAERIVLLLLAVLMAATRIHHFGIGAVAPDASTAVFFLLGLLAGSPLWFAGFSILAIGLDAIALGPLEVADACMTPGYWLLFAGYLALWFAGRMGRGVTKLDLAQGARLLILAVAGTLVFFVLSNVGYYFGGGFAESMGAAEYVSRVQRYLPMYLGTTLAYAVAGVAVFVAGARLLDTSRAAAR